MMQVELGELLTFGAAIIGGCWTLLGISAKQHEKRLDERFKTISDNLEANNKVLTDRMDAEFKHIYGRTASSEANAREIGAIQLQFAEYKAKVAETYCTKAEVQSWADKHADQTNRALERIEGRINDLFRLVEQKADKTHGRRHGDDQHITQ